MKYAIVLAMFLILPGLLLAACSSPAVNGQPANAGGVNSLNVPPTAIKAVLNSGLATITLDEVETFINTRFVVNTATERLTFMAYKYNDRLYVRADICPPCRSESFSLLRGTLVCNACGTVFDAQTGKGIRGACVSYDKQPVSFEIENGEILMKESDLNTAYRDTLRPGR